LVDAPKDFLKALNLNASSSDWKLSVVDLSEEKTAEELKSR